MSDLVPADAIAHVAALERELQTTACRADESRLRELLADDFVEVGASGRRWDRDGVLELLRAEGSRSDVEDIEVEALSTRVLAAGVVQVFWDSERAGRRARRTSIWCERDGRWQQAYHQGTLLSDQDT